MACFACKCMLKMKIFENMSCCISKCSQFKVESEFMVHLSQKCVYKKLLMMKVLHKQYTYQLTHKGKMAKRQKGTLKNKCLQAKRQVLGRHAFLPWQTLVTRTTRNDLKNTITTSKTWNWGAGQQTA